MLYKVYVSVPDYHNLTPYILRIEADSPEQARSKALADFPGATIWVD